MNNRALQWTCGEQSPVRGLTAASANRDGQATLHLHRKRTCAEQIGRRLHAIAGCISWEVKGSIRTFLGHIPPSSTILHPLRTLTLDMDARSYLHEAGQRAPSDGLCALLNLDTKMLGTSCDIDVFFSLPHS